VSNLSSRDERDRVLDEAATALALVIRQLGITHGELARRMAANEELLLRLRRSELAHAGRSEVLAPKLHSTPPSQSSGPETLIHAAPRRLPACRIPPIPGILPHEVWKPLQMVRRSTYQLRL
jgi:hypothetical protein